MKQLSSLAVRLGALVVACGVYLAVADISGFAQQAQAPAPGAGAAPGQGGAPGAPGAAGQGQRGGGGGGGRGVQLGDGPWEYGNGPNRFRVSVITKGIDYPWGIAFLPEWRSAGDWANGGTGPGPDACDSQGSARSDAADWAAGGLQGRCPRRGARWHARRDSSSAVRQEPADVLRVYSKSGGEKGATTAVARGRWDGGSALDRRQGHPRRGRMARRTSAC